MNFELSEEQHMLVDSINKFIQNDYDFETRRRLAASELGYSADHWKMFAELGWLSVPFAEGNGGFGGTAVDVMLMMEAFGRALVTEPFIPTVIMGGRLVETLGNPDQKAALLAPVIQGELQLALAYDEPVSRGNPACVGTRATAVGDGYTLSGDKVMVLNGHAADKLLVTARTRGSLTDVDGISVFVVEAAAEGVTVTPYPTMEGGRAANISFNNAPAELLGDAGQALPAIETVLDEAVIALGAEAVGAMEVLYKNTVDYCKTRKQFGLPIGKFQVLQHRMVDMFMAHELTQSSMYMAGLRNLEGGEVAKKAASAFKVQVGKAGRFIGQQAVQLHGGMGMTDELNVGFYFKRLTAMDALLGNTDFHLNRYGRVA
ncbi:MULTISPECIES: acyl-CoA dehydrogenase family protein [unclassified Ketobacter]|uniref:acyl-CoA dehydrogenase family protein n=1 Tax=unclassified Ketobacter TaxID=2639109 RepID=UPI000F28C69A|nr:MULTISPECIES: acyl-CoA dehydrogenase [unclassified Ketobacter]RLT91289.1 MAG: pimeloyl-CoA dehydrogenase small subunit [Ketobacter sp. GenoA1]RLT98276.1 MAG: pimeloyl-CoA dehydrogenase small subunit [Ketobacter sp.]